MKRLFVTVGALALIATAASAKMLTPAEFVGKAGQSDTFEIDSAQQMVQMAAKQDGVMLKKPELTVGQRTDLTALKAVPAGKSKDDLYVKQQKASHADALALMQDYAASGTATHLKATAAKIAPVVEQHQALLNKM